jgi:putative FmdB family regulatory protein
MPLYEYKCVTCGREFELLVRGPEAVSCPACASSSVERMVSSFAVSSEASRQISRASVHKRNTKNRLDHNMAEVERLKHHDDDH